MAGDLTRAVGVLDVCSARVAALTGLEQRRVFSHLAEETVAQLDTQTIGQQRDLIIGTAVSASVRMLEASANDAAQTLAVLTEMPSAAMRTSAGWRAALAHEGHDVPKRLTRATLNQMPGTVTANLVSDVMALTQELDSIKAARWHTDLEDHWNRQHRSGTFDATIARLQEQHDHVQDVAWALVTFESHKHVNLIWHQANKLERSFPDRSAADLLGWGWIGLRAALRHYDPDLGYTFSTYACTRIVGAIRDGVRAENPVPKRLNTFSRKAAAAEAELTQTLGRVPTLEEVSSTIGVELSSLDILHRTQPQASIDEILGILSERGTAPGWLVTGDDPAKAALDEVLAEAITNALAQLSPDDAAAVRLLVMDGLNPTEARAVTGATARQLRQRKERALALLRDALAEWNIDADTA